MKKTKTATDGMSKADRALQMGMAGLGAALLLGSLGIVMENAMTSPRPAFIEVIEIERDLIAGRSRVQVEAINRGDVTAAAVTLQGRAVPDRVATATLDYVPGQSRKTATLTFAGDLGTARLTLEATGWVDP